jgi:phenylalanyl-tRNA synthetase beta chain
MKLLTSIFTKLLPEYKLDINDLSKSLTSLAYEVEEFYQANSIEGVKVAKVVSCDKHPNADTLSLCKVKLFDGEEMDVICGGANIATGQIVA